MHKLVIDLEMTDKTYIKQEKRGIALREIIEIGAVLLDDDNRQVDTFRTYVKPRFSMVGNYIQNLTGITNELIEDAPYFEDAIQTLLDNTPDDVMLCTWSDSDTTAITKELKAKGIHIERLDKLCEEYFDIQQELSKKLNFGHRLNLKKALELIGIEFNGREHGALDDAINTAKLYQSMYEDEKIMDNINNIKNIMEASHLTSSLGSMFDFSKLKLE